MCLSDKSICECKDVECFEHIFLMIKVDNESVKTSISDKISVSLPSSSDSMHEIEPRKSSYNMHEKLNLEDVKDK